jgi:hypothetical protein
MVKLHRCDFINGEKISMNIRDHIRIVPDFPIEGINFYDIATLLAHPDAWRATVADLVERISPYKPDMLMGIESRGFLVAAPLALELGYKHKLSSGTVVDVSFLPTVISGETWQNPYQLNTKRRETDITGNAYRLKLESISGSSFSLDLAYAKTNVEEDAIAGTDLARDAESYYAKGSYRFAVAPTSFLIPSATYIQHNADGRANSFDSWGTDISWFNILGKHTLVLTAGYSRRNYDSASTLFNKARSDDELSLFAAYEYPNFMEWKDWSLTSFAGYGDTQSNLTFYDESSYLLAVGLNYKF